MAKFISVIGVRYMAIGGRGKESRSGWVSHINADLVIGSEPIEVSKRILIREGNEHPITLSSQVRCSADRKYLRAGEQAYDLNNHFMCPKHFSLLPTREKVEGKYGGKYYKVTISD